MREKRRSGRPTTKKSVEDEIAHLRGLDLKGFRARWLSVFQRPAPDHLPRHLLFEIIEEVLDWRPFDYLTISTLLPMPDAPKVIMSYAFLEEKPGTTLIEVRLARPKPKDQAFLDHVGAEFQKTITAEIAKLRHMLEGQDGAPAAVEEPMLPVPARASG